MPKALQKTRKKSDKVKSSRQATLPVKKYINSAGAHATKDDISRKFERNAYNFIQLSLKDKSYKNVDPNLLALHLQQFSLYNIGVKSWDETAKILLYAANYIRKSKLANKHPVWIAMYRHAKSAVNAEVANEFLSHGISNQPIDHRAWSRMPDILKFEQLVFEAGYKNDLPLRLKSDKSLRAFFKNPVFVDSVLLAICNGLHQSGRLSDMRHCLNILAKTNPRLFELEACDFGGLLLATSRFRRALCGHDKDLTQGKALLDKTWQKITQLSTQQGGALARHKAVEALYRDRIESANQLQDKDADKRAHIDWQSYLHRQIHG